MKKKFLALSVLGMLLASCGTGGTSSSVNDPSSFSSASSNDSSISLNSSESVDSKDSASSSKPSSSNSSNSGSKNSSSSKTSSASSSKPSSSSSKPSSSSSTPSSSSSVSSSVESKIAVVINNLSGDVSEIVDYPKEALAGETISFKVVAKAGWVVKDVEIKSSKNRNLKFTELNDFTYELSLPSDGIINVTVNVVAETKYQHLYVIDNKNLSKGTPMLITEDGFKTIFDYVIEDTEIPYYIIPEDSKVRFSLPNPNYYSSLGIAFNSNEYTPDDYGYVDIDFTGIKGNLVCNIFGNKLMQDLNAVNSAHLTLSFYSDAGFKNEITQIGIDENFYIKIDNADMFGYALKALTYSFKYVGSSVETTHDITSEVKEEEEFYWRKHSSPTSPCENGITYTVTEDDLNKYKDEPFIGRYLSVQLFTYQDKNFTSWSDNQLTIIGSGKSTYGPKTYMIQNVYDDEHGITHLSDREVGVGSEMYYKNDIILASNDGSTTISTLFTHAFNSYGDDMALFKIQPDTKPSDYQLYAASFVIEGRLKNVITAYLNGEFYRAVFLDKTTENSRSKYYMDVTIDMIYGEHVTDDKAIYKIYDSDNNELAFIGFQGKGGNKSRILLNGENNGVYTNDQNDELIICENNAVLNGTLFSCSVNGNVATLTSAEKDYTITLDIENRTFVITNTVTRQIVIGPFAGKEYRCQWNNGLNGSYGYYIKFAQNEATMSCLADIYWNMSMTNKSGEAFGITEDALYIYNPTTQIITAQVFGYNNALVTMHFKYEGSRITFSADELSGNSGVFRTKTIVLDEVK